MVKENELYIGKCCLPKNQSRKFQNLMNQMKTKKNASWSCQEAKKENSQLATKREILKILLHIKVQS